MESQSTMGMTTEIVANYVANNEVAINELPALIRLINKALSNLGEPPAIEDADPAKPTAAQIRKSIRPEGLVSFLDGKTYKTLKRHLSTQGVSVAEYRERFSLPSTYPMTSPEYSAKRSEMAKMLGLGRQRAESEAVKEPAKRGKAKG